MNAKQCSAFTLSALLLSGCGYKFVGDVSDLNKPVPPYFSERDFIANEQLAPLGGTIDWFAGRLGYKGNDGKFHFTDRLLVGAPTLKVVTLQDPPTYHVVVDKGFTAEAGIPLLKGDATGKTAMDFQMTDVENIVVPDEAKPDRATAQSKATGVPPGAALWWVNVVGLSMITYSQSSNVTSSTNLTGAAYSANASVYDKPSVSSHVPVAAVLVVPMNDAADKELAAAPKPKAPPAASPPPVLSGSSSLVHPMIKPMISIGADNAKALPLPQWRQVLTRKGSGVLDWTDDSSNKK